MNASQGQTKKLGKVAVVFDERLSRQKTAALIRTFNAMRPFVEIKLLKGGIGEEELLAELKNFPPHLVLLPWYRYLSWSKAEGFFGLTRNSGPTVVGYHTGQVTPAELGEAVDYLRAIFLDLSSTTPTEAALLVRAIVQDKTRAGLLPLIEPETPVYCERWYDQQGLGTKIDSVLGLSEIAQSEWIQRSSEIRIAMSSLWSLIYELGPGKSEFHQAITNSKPKAAFQLAVGKHFLLMRLSYSMPSWTPKEVIRNFWNNKEAATSAPQLLLRYADLIRVHTFSEGGEVEVVVGFFKSGGAAKAPDMVHSLWIEPLASNLIFEPPYDMPGTQTAPHLRPLPGATVNEARVRETADAGSRDKQQIAELQQQLREMKRVLRDRDDQIQEMRSGGISTAQPLPLPDPEGLIEAFQERFFDSRFQIREFELKIQQLEKRGAQPHEVKQLQQQMITLTRREESWIRKLAETLRLYREEKQKPAS